MRPDFISQKLNYFHSTGKKSVAILVDPDSAVDEEELSDLVSLAVGSNVDFFFIGGSLAAQGQCHRCVELIKFQTDKIPVVLFPGNAIQVVDIADGILFLSLISGRNPEFLIGQQVIAAPFLSKSSLEVLPTGYMLVESGSVTSVNYMSQTIPLPNDKPDLAIATALAGTMLGLKHIFLDAGSGAVNPVSREIISGVRSHTDCPLMVGGGIDSVAKANAAWDAGADLIVLGNAVEKNPNLLIEVLTVARIYNLSLNVN